ncbi:DMT family transporter [Polaribacter sp. R77954]|uniref:DMT family transporter n=1 Tax=Polaribacter sp. R77954 TaxID=3093870 RepID=UPI0037CB5846
MNNQQQKWLYLILLALVWGSSFILMKKALIGLTPIQLGALRIIFTALFLFSTSASSVKKIKRKHWKYITFTAFAASFFPVFLFAFSVHQIDSAVVSILNCFTPFNTLIFGALLFGFSFRKVQFYGILIGLVGCAILILTDASINENQNYWYAIFVLIASVGYALNVNMVKKYLQDVPPRAIVTGNFLLIFIPAIIVLYATGFFSDYTYNTEGLMALGYVAVLAVFGTGLAKIMYNKLVQISTPIFSSSVTYLIPLVAVFWGLIDGEEFGIIQLLGGTIILLGVYLVNKKK